MKDTASKARSVPDSKSDTASSEKIPIVALTMGDPSGIGPEIIAKAWPRLSADSSVRFVVIGNASAMKRAVEILSSDLDVSEVDSFDQVHSIERRQVVCLSDDALKVSTPQDGFIVGEVNRESGDAAFRYIDTAIQATLAGSIDSIVTAPINKEAIKLAGHDFPGHTEILADRCGVQNFAMMLYIPQGHDVGGEIGVGVVHTTLHQSLRSAIEDLSTDSIFGKCQLANDFAKVSLLQAGHDRAPRIAVAALNPHGGENGLFGDEEATIIRPAVERAIAAGIDCTGPLPCDTLMGRAVAGEFDMVVAVYHDQGHIALKLLGMHKAVNVTLGLPIIRTSVAHGTAFAIAGTGQADCTSLLQAVDIAKRMAIQNAQ